MATITTTTLTEQRMTRIWNRAELAGTDAAWYDASYMLHKIADALDVAVDEAESGLLDSDIVVITRLRDCVSDWRFLSGIALQRALIANRDAKTVQLEVAA